MPLTIACFKWRKIPGAPQLLPQVPNLVYSAKHVNILYYSLGRNLKIPFNFVCVTDDSSGLDHRIEVIPLWDKCRNLGGCYNRLYVFSKDMRSLLGRRFACIDLDCVITGDVTPIFSRQEDFIINSYKPFPAHKFNMNQKYNGGLFIMNAGCRKQVWETFDPKKSPDILTKAHDICVGTDQGWIRYVLGENEAVLTEKDGIYEARAFSSTLPNNAKIVMFAGQRDPSLSTHKWVTNNWY